MSDAEAISQIHKLITDFKWQMIKKDDQREQIQGYEVIVKMTEIQRKIEEYLSVGREISKE